MLNLTVMLFLNSPKYFMNSIFPLQLLKQTCSLVKQTCSLAIACMQED